MNRIYFEDDGDYDGHDFVPFQFSEGNYSFCGQDKNTTGTP